jgi:hypothetical protein
LGSAFALSISREISPAAPSGRSCPANTLVQPILKLHGFHVLGNMTVPRRLAPVLDVRLFSLAGGFRQAGEFMIAGSG